MMNEKRFELDGTGIFDNKTNRFFFFFFDNEEVVDLLNDQEEEIRKLQMENFALKRLCEEYIIKIEHLEKM